MDDFEFDDDFQKEPYVPATQDSLSKAFKKTDLPTKGLKDLLPYLVTSAHKLQLNSTDFAERVSDFIIASNLPFTQTSVEKYVQDESIAKVEEFLAGNYDLELDLLTKKAEQYATKDISTSSTHQQQRQQYQNQSNNINQYDEYNDDFNNSNNNSHSTMNELLSPSKPPSQMRRSWISPHHTTPTTSSKSRTQLTPLLSSPSSTFPEHHQKGQVLIRFAPNKKSNNNNNDNNTDTTKTNPTSSQTTLFDNIDSTSNNIKVPIYVLSWLFQSIKSRNAKLLEHRANGGDVSNTPNLTPDPSDPLKTDLKPFRYLDWDHQKAVEIAMKRQTFICDAITESEIFINDFYRLYPESNIDDMCYLEDFTQQQIQPAWYAGHIKNHFNNIDGGPRLTATTITLSNFKSECVLKLSHKDILHYSFFPGQHIVLRGTNVTGNALVPDVIYTESMIESYDRIKSMERYWSIVYRAAFNRWNNMNLKRNKDSSSTTTTTTTKRLNLFNTTMGDNDTTTNNNNDQTSTTTSTTTTTTTDIQPQELTNPIPTCADISKLITDRPIKVVTASGPFVSSKGSIQAISSILDLIANEPTTPEVLILMGPFVDVESSLLTFKPTGLHDNDNLIPFTQNHYPQRTADGNIIQPTTTTTTSTEGDNNNNNNDTNDGVTNLCQFPVYKSDIFLKYKTTPNQNTTSTTPNEQSTTSNHPPLSLYRDLFQETLDFIITALNSNPATQNMTVITIPSPRDIHHFPCFPQPGYDYTYQLPTPMSINTVRIINAPNPCEIDINGVVFSATTTDIFSHFMRYELFSLPTVTDDVLKTTSNSTPTTSTSTPLKNTPNKNDLVQLGSPTIGTTTTSLLHKRSVRLISHILSQQSFAPISTLQSNPTLEFVSNVRTSLEMNVKPDILLLPSKTPRFIEAVPMPGHLNSNVPINDPSDDFIQRHGHVLAINPSSVIKNEGLGELALITIFNNNNNTNGTKKVDVIERVSAEVIHL